jgi:predicted membrane-bound spermidine synthase
MNEPPHSKYRLSLTLPTQPWISGAFLLSGFSALIYQVVWQRVLFAAFGINVEAVAVVVTAFLVGLGIGSVIGGLASTRSRPPLPVIFAAFELGVGAYGAISVPLFRVVGTALAAEQSIVTGLVTFGLVLFPTVLMGATLPVLVEYGVRATHNVGRSLGWLYFVNTAGSAIAAILAAIIILGRLGELKATWLAAGINFLVSGFVVLRYRQPAGLAR